MCVMSYLCYQKRGSGHGGGSKLIQSTKLERSINDHWFLSKTVAV